MSPPFLAKLQQPATLTEKFRSIHAAMSSRLACITMASAAVYDAGSDTLTSLLQSGATEHPVMHFQSTLSAEPSLQEIVRNRAPRIIQDYDRVAFEGEPYRRLRAAGIRSSYTVPFYADGELLGFLFFNSRERAPFSGDVLDQLNVYGHLLAQVISQHIKQVRVLGGTIKTLREVARLRDDETAAHLDRMSHYAHLIARIVATKYRLSDEEIEHIFLFAPLHDIGKIGVPDHILLKNGPLTDDERAKMKKHTILGRELVDQLIANLGFEQLQGLETLRNICELHHETLDGSGYPYGLRGDKIPIEARIVSVADVFDALTSRRPYKRAWSIDEAFATLHQMSGTKLESSCVAALIGNRREVEKIQRQFRDEEDL